MADKVLILAMETSSQGGSVCVLDDEQVLGEAAIAPRQTARQLAPTVKNLWDSLRIAPQQIQLVAVASGPGSFTGLRIGITTAKTLAYALKCDLVAVDTLDAIAAAVDEAEAYSGMELHVIMDAQRRELFVARYGPAPPVAGSGWKRRAATELVDAETWLTALQPPALVSGPGLRRWSERIPAGVVVVPADSWEPSAAMIGKLAYAMWQAGRRDDVFGLKPTYLRPSYADEKRQ